MPIEVKVTMKHVAILPHTRIHTMISGTLSRKRTREVHKNTLYGLIRSGYETSDEEASNDDIPVLAK